MLTVTRKRSRVSSPIGCSAIDVRGAGLHVGVRAHLERDPHVPDVRRQPAELDGAVVVDGDVVDDPDAVAQPGGAAPLDGLPDRRQPERLAGVDGEVRVLALEVLEGVEVPGGRVARLRAGDVEAGDPAVPPGHGQLRDLARAGLVPHRGQQVPHRDPPLPRLGSGHALVEALLDRGDDLVERQPGADVLLGGVAHLGVDDPVRGQVLDALPGDPGEGRGGLHDPDGVVEGLQVAHQRPRVGAVGEPGRQVLGGPRRAARSPTSSASSSTVCGPQAAVEVVVQQHLRCPPHLVLGGPGALARLGQDGAHVAILSAVPPDPGGRQACARSPAPRSSRPRSARTSAPPSGSRSTRTGSTCSPTPPTTTSGSTSTRSARPPARSAARSRTATSPCR